MHLNFPKNTFTATVIAGLLFADLTHRNRRLMPNLSARRSLENYRAPYSSGAAEKTRIRTLSMDKVAIAPKNKVP